MADRNKVRRLIHIFSNDYKENSFLRYSLKNESTAPILHMRGSRGGGGRGSGPPLKNHKNIRFLSNTGPDPMKNRKATKPAFNMGHHQHASETPFKWRFVGGPMVAPIIVVFGSSLPS